MSTNGKSVHDDIQVGYENMDTVAMAVHRFNDNIGTLNEVQESMWSNAALLVREARAAQWNASAIVAMGYVLTAFWVEKSKKLVIFASVDPMLLLPEIKDRITLPFTSEVRGGLN